VLGAIHALTGIAWFAYKNVTSLLTSSDAVCWPVFPYCEGVREHLSRSTVRALVAMYIALGLSSAISFALRRTRSATITLGVAWALGTFIYFLDYRMRLNQTYMLSWICVAFFFARRKVETLSALVGAFYFSAGLLKLTPDWLSGRALYAKPLFVPESLVPLSCIYVVVLEIVLVWGLFGTRHRVRYAVLAQLALFHLVSWPVVGWFYPLEMLGLLSIFVLGEPTSVRALKGALPFLVPFALAQVVPAFFRGDAALTGEGRIFALHMFDAQVSCTGGAVVDGRTIPLVAEGSDVRSRCDPIILLAHAKMLCRSPRGRIDVAVDAKKASDATMRPLVRIEDVCASAPSYSVFRENPWIVAR
jgi:hypothetical protein